jgi:uncharacterized protein (DUF2267 family)
MKTSGDIENRERDLKLSNRDPQPVVMPAVEAELQALRARIALARATDPTATAPQHCSDCYSRGWKAALKALED